MTITELVQRAMRGEVVGSGALQILFLANCILRAGLTDQLLELARAADETDFTCAKQSDRQLEPEEVRAEQ